MSGPTFVVRDEHGYAHTLAPAVAQCYLSQGLIWREGGMWVGKYADLYDTGHTHPECAVCDFCSQQSVVWEIKCDSFDFSKNSRSTLNWFACDACGQLVKAKNSRALLDRQVQRYGEAGREQLQKIARKFWRHYAGSVTRIAQ